MNWLQKLLFLPVNYRRETYEHPWVMTQEYIDYIEKYGAQDYYWWQTVRDRFILACIFVFLLVLLALGVKE